MKKHLLVVILMFAIVCMLLLCFRSLNAQSYTINFHWTDPNTVPCNYDVFEVCAPPDTNTVLWVCNRDPVPNCKTGCTWPMEVWPDNKAHYYRMRAFAPNDKYSPLSNTAKITFAEPLKAVHLIDITF